MGRVRGSDAYANRKEQISAASANQTPVLPGALPDRQHKTHMQYVSSTCPHSPITKRGSRDHFIYMST